MLSSHRLLSARCFGTYASLVKFQPIYYSEKSMSQFTPAQLLSKLCDYYLECLAKDDSFGVSIWASNKFKPSDLDYKILGYTDSGTFTSQYNQGADLLSFSKLRAKGGVRHVLKAAAGVLVRNTKTKKGEGKKLIPLIVYNAEFTDKENLSVEYKSGAFNILALKELYAYGDSLFKSELTEVEQVLNLGTSKPSVNPLTALELLQQIRPGWDWKDITPDLLSRPDLEEGIYKTPLLFAVPDSNYTQGLEHELAKLSVLSDQDIEGTALHYFLEGVSKTEDFESPSHLLEVLPLNQEQRKAVSTSIYAPVTLISGPPGTGKSQVISNLLVNNIWSSQTCLFTSKNNKAVDVVDQRVNALGQHPVMVRLGAGEHRSKLAESLSNLLNVSSTEEDVSEYEAFRQKHSNLIEELFSLRKKEADLVSMRNALESCYSEAKELLEDIEADVIPKLTQYDCQQAQELLAATKFKLAEMDRNSHGVLVRALWPIAKRKFAKNLNESFFSLSSHLTAACVEVEYPDGGDIANSMQKVLGAIESYLAEVKTIQTFINKSKTFSKESFEELAKERISLQTQITLSSEQLWKRWVRIKSYLLDKEQKEKLSQYGAIMQIVRTAKAEEDLSDENKRQYRALTLAARGIFNCFAVTSLSAHNRVPFEAAAFDTVVFDEASQCDIASALPLLYRAKKAVVIGDPQQLNHVSRISREFDFDILKSKGLDMSYAQWMYSTQSLFDLAASFTPKEYRFELKEHHRSHPDIISFSNSVYYGNRLRQATKLSSLVKSDKNSKAISWVEIQGKTDRGIDGGALNEAEAQAVVEKLKEISLSGYKGSVGVVTPFRKQVQTIEALLKKESALYSKLIANNNLHINTAHGFQGDERDLMLLSVVLTPTASPTVVKYMQNESNVFNVAVTRARAELIVFGDGVYCGQCEVPHLRKFQNYVNLVMHRPARSLESTQDLTDTWPSSVMGNSLEKEVYTYLFSKGVKSIPKYDTGSGIVSMAVFLGERRIALLVDDSLKEDWDYEKCEREQVRSVRLLEQGWEVKRVFSFTDLKTLLKNNIY